METCEYYKGNNYCNLHKSKVASAYCGDICDNETKICDICNTKITEHEFKNNNGYCHECFINVVKK